MAYVVNEVVVKKWMTTKEDNPMPYMRMAGFRLKETAKAVYMRCRGEIFTECTEVCMRCGRPITNPVSRYFGLGPVCGHHEYINPFASEFELQKAVNAYREETLHKTVWEGWIPKSQIVSEKPIEDFHK